LVLALKKDQSMSVEYEAEWASEGSVCFGEDKKKLQPYLETNLAFPVVKPVK
jgi:hypothetical protein